MWRGDEQVVPGGVPVTGGREMKGEMSKVFQEVYLLQGIEGRLVKGEMTKESRKCTCYRG